MMSELFRSKASLCYVWHHIILVHYQHSVDTTAINDITIMTANSMNVLVKVCMTGTVSHCKPISAQRVPTVCPFICPDFSLQNVILHQFATSCKYYLMYRGWGGRKFYRMCGINHTSLYTKFLILRPSQLLTWKFTHHLYQNLYQSKSFRDLCCCQVASIIKLDLIPGFYRPQSSGS